MCARSPGWPSGGGNKLVNIHGWVPGTGVAAALATICSYPNATWLEVPHDPPAITPDSFQGIVKETASHQQGGRLPVLPG